MFGCLLWRWIMLCRLRLHRDGELRNERESIALNTD
jgi:hypothetical protein